MPKLILCALLVCAGCMTGPSITGSFKESITDGTGATTSTEYSATSKAGLFSKLDAAANKFTYKLGENGSIAVGSEGSGFDSTPQIEALSALGKTLAEVSEINARLIEAVMPLLSPAVPLEGLP